jgi:hypothetical protein
LKIEEREKRKNSKVKDRVEEEEGKWEVGKVGGGEAGQAAIRASSVAQMEGCT